MLFLAHFPLHLVLELFHVEKELRDHLRTVVLSKGYKSVGW